MINLLYIHGFGSNHNAGSFLALKKAFPSYNFISADFDLLDVEGTLAKIDDICKKNEIHVIIGKSLGAFYTLAYKRALLKIVINPCMKPWIEIPKLDNTVDSKVLEKWEKLFYETENAIESQTETRTFAIFGDKDELFSYKDYFDAHYGETCASLKKSFFVPGKHHIDIEPLSKGVKKAFTYFNMMAEYNEVFQLMPYYQLFKNCNDNNDLNYTEEEKQYIIDRVNTYNQKMLAYQKDDLL